MMLAKLFHSVTGIGYRILFWCVSAACVLHFLGTILSYVIPQIPRLGTSLTAGVNTLFHLAIAAFLFYLRQRIAWKKSPARRSLGIFWIMHSIAALSSLALLFVQIDVLQDQHGLHLVCVLYQKKPNANGTRCTAFSKPSFFSRLYLDACAPSGDQRKIL